jgi:hypothetical protein
MENTQVIDVLSENEQIVRAYKCTKLRRLFAKPITGYLSVTNKRIVYHSEGKSITGKNEVISEMPLEDIAGISTFYGTSFNILLFVIFGVVLFGVTNLINQFASGFLWVVGILLCLPYGVGSLFEKKILNQSIADSVNSFIEKSPIGGWVKGKESGYFWGLVNLLLNIGLPIFAFKLTVIPVLGYIALIAAYYFVFTQVFGGLQTFSLQIKSRTAKGSGILIPGNFVMALLSGNSTAAQSMFAGPNDDANLIIKELGAMVLDIQQMGDLGIKKWKK